MHLFSSASTLCAITALMLAFGSIAYAEGDANDSDAKQEEANTPPSANADETADETADDPAGKAPGKAAGPQRQKGRRMRGQAQGRGGFPPGMAELRLLKEMSKELGIDEKGTAKLDAMSEEFRAEESRLTDEMSKATKKVSTLLDQGRPDKKAVLEASRAASAVGQETRQLRLDLTMSVRALLTDEQLTKFMKQRTEAMQSRRRRGGRPRK